MRYNTRRRNLQAWLAVSAAAGLFAFNRPGNQVEQYISEVPQAIEIPKSIAVPKTIVDLQLFRRASSVHVSASKGKDGVATLINLHPAVNAWYLLKVAWAGSAESAYHLENAEPRSQRILLDEKYPSGVVIASGNSRIPCDLFSPGSPNQPDPLDQAKASSQEYAPLCGGRLYLRNPATGHRSTLEAATEFLRDHVWGGESIIGLGHILMGDWNRETGELKPGASGASTPAHAAAQPLPARVDPQAAGHVLQSANLGIDLDPFVRNGLAPGAWYLANGSPGIYVSLLQPDLIDPEIFRTYKSSVNNLDSVEASALVYLIAFDLDRYDLGFALGTEHPRVDWSEHAPANMKDPSLPGPDGIGSISPLVSTGLVSPAYASRTVATFTGGFKRAHGAFKYGDLSLKNHGSHYGFIEQGVVFSKLQPGLATIFVLNDGAVYMKTWAEADNALLEHIVFARQNGVPVIDLDAASKTPVPGPLVNKWGPGNWSGSSEEKLRTMRGGLALASNGGKRFLVYAVFSDATPSAMARVFQAYRCDYAMLLDMNALEHTYLALYRRSGPQLFVDHLLKGMGVLEKTDAGEIVPRFLGYADNRDFFYVMRK